MSKDKSREILRLPGKKHSIPRVMVPFLDHFSLLDSTEIVGLGPYRKTKNNKTEINIKGYDDITNLYRLEINHGKYLWYLFPKVFEKNKEKFEKDLGSLIEELQKF